MQTAPTTSPKTDLSDVTLEGAPGGARKEVSVSYDEWNTFLHDLGAYLKATTRQISFGNYMAHQESAEKRLRASLDALDAKFEAIRAAQSGQE